MTDVPGWQYAYAIGRIRADLIFASEEPAERTLERIRKVLADISHHGEGRS